MTPREEDEYLTKLRFERNRAEALESNLANLRRKLDEATKERDFYLACLASVKRQDDAAETRLASAVGALKVYAANEHWDNDDDDEQRRCFVWLCHETGPDEFGGSLARAALASQPVDPATTGATPGGAEGKADTPCKCDAPECLYYDGNCKAPCIGPRPVGEVKP
jgi:hypothetical protein